MRLRQLTAMYSTKLVEGTSQIRTSLDVVRVLRAMNVHQEVQESFFAITLNTRHRVISIQRVATGTVCSVEVHPRDVFRGAVQENAVAVIVAHNHPSGEAEPSPQDDQITRRLAKCGGILGVPVLDHVVLADDTYFSYQERRPDALAASVNLLDP